MKAIRNFLILTVLFSALGSIAKAQSVTYTCTYKNGTEKEIIGTSSLKTNVVAKKSFNNLSYTFVIADSNNFDESNDYVTIEDDKKHVITYPLSCKR